MGFNHFQARYLARSQPHLLMPQNKRGSGGTTASSSAASGDAAAGGADSGAGGSTSAASVQAPKPIPQGVNASPLEGGDPGLWEKDKGNEDGYTWSQTPQELTVEINVEKCKASEIKVDFSARKISVKCKGKVIVEGKLHDKISCEDSTWHLDDGKLVVLSMEKIKPAFWEKFIEK